KQGDLSALRKAEQPNAICCDLAFQPIYGAYHIVWLTQSLVFAASRPEPAVLRNTQRSPAFGREPRTDGCNSDRVTHISVNDNHGAVPRSFRPEQISTKGNTGVGAGNLHAGRIRSFWKIIPGIGHCEVKPRSTGHSQDASMIS